MKKITLAAMAVAGLALTACTEGDDQFAENVEQAHDNAADQLDQAAENMTGQQAERTEDAADVLREAGEAAADEIDDQDMTGPANVALPANTQ